MQSKKNEIVGLLTELLYVSGYCCLFFGLVYVVTR